MQTAPLYEDVAGGPAGGVAHWLTTSDGLRIRAGHWASEDARGTILLFPGRTEYIEKYGMSAVEFAKAGFATLAVDWRGQGLADRMHDDRGMGHVLEFEDYQRDVAALVDHARALKLPEPYFLLAHSMGGGIGLQALMNGLPVRGAVFSAPMWGISLSRLLKPYAWTVATIGRVLGQGNRVTPGQSTTSFMTPIAIENSELTHDAAMLDFVNEQVAKYPDLAIGGPSLRWLHETLIATRDMARKPSPDVPALTFLGGKETIVDSQRIRDRMHAWPKGKLTVIPGGKHEMLIETPDIRNQVYDETIAFLNAQL